MTTLNQNSSTNASNGTNNHNQGAQPTQNNQHPQEANIANQPAMANNRPATSSPTNQVPVLPWEEAAAKPPTQRSTGTRIKNKSPFTYLNVGVGLTLAVILMIAVGCGLRRGDNGQETITSTGTTLRLVQGADPTQVEVWVDNVSGFYALDMEIDFDATQLQVADADDIKDGTQIEAGEAPVPDFVAENNVDNQLGKIHYIITQVAPREGFSGSGRVATINWQEDFNQNTPISFGQVILVNQDAEPIEVKIAQFSE